MLQPHETWTIQDASKIQEAMTCLRSYFFRYVAGWQPELPSIHLEFGTAWHLAMEYLLLHGYSDESIQGAYEAFLSHYRTYFGQEQDTLLAPKNPANALRGLAHYCDRYKRDLDDFEVLYTEISGSVWVEEGRRVYFRSDAICRRKSTGKIFSLEHKTASSFSRQWTNQWAQSMQVNVYSHVLHCHFDSPNVEGVIINGFMPHDPPALKKDGELRAGAKDLDFIRIPIRRSTEKLNDWLYNVNYWLDCIEESFDLLKTQDPEAPVMTCFPKNTKSCANFFGCPYRDYCDAWPNPLSRIEVAQPGFVVRYWDPRVGAIPAKHIMEI